MIVCIVSYWDVTPVPTVERWMSA
eukprot:COSAG02_NODE_54813_length_294_cov_0.671795_2_plen_23_part_01